MGKIRVYIKPFNELGEYAEFIEVTNDVTLNGLSQVTKSIDSTEYDAGVFKYSSFNVKMANETGRYSDVDTFQSIFRYKRSDSIIKITWNPNLDDDVIAGTYIATGETTVYEGLLSDEATSLNILSQQISFKCLGYESLFDRIEVPYSSLSIGDTFEEIILACVDQAPFNELITVSASNIDVGIDVATDSIEDLENQTVKEALDDILVHSNSVLYIKDNTLYVTDRTPSASSDYIFYGQASEDGIENIQDINNLRNGVNRVFNLLTWEDVSNSVTGLTSKSLYGVRKKEIGTSLITNSTNIDSVLQSYVDEFENPKQEFNLTCSFDSERVLLDLLDRVNVDYPTVFVPGDDNDLPLWGTAVWGDFVWPFGQWSITISPTDSYKLISVKYNISKEILTFKLRKI